MTSRPKVTFGSFPAKHGPSRPPSPRREESPARSDSLEVKLDPLETLVEHSRKKHARTTYIGFQCPLEILKIYADMMNVSIEVSPGSPPHTHPRLALERRLAVDYIFSSHPKWAKTGTVIDIGASMTQHKGRNFVHGLCPLLTPSDVYRNNRYADQCPELRWCNHTMQQCTSDECNCVTDPIAAVSVHSGYYLRPEDIVRFLKVKGITMYMVVHRFKELEGSIHEMAYNKVGMEIIAKIAGDTYQHDSLDWLDAPGNAILTAAGTLAWHLDLRIGQTWVYAMYYSPVAPIQQSLQFENAVSDNHTFGNINLGKLNTQHATHVASLVHFELDLPVTAISIGGYLEVTTQAHKSVIIPKTCFHELLFVVSMTPRTPDNFMSHVSKAKRSLVDYKMSAEMRAKAIGPLAVLTFFWNAKEDEAILQSSLRKFGQWTARLGETLKFTIFPHLTLRKVLLSLAGVVTVYLSYKRVVTASVSDCVNYSQYMLSKEVTFSDALEMWKPVVNGGARFSRLASPFLAYVTFNVFAEEAFKWVVPWGDHAIVAFEFLATVLRQGPSGIPGRIITTFIHYIHRSTKLGGFAAHWAWNVWVYMTIQNVLQHRGLIMKLPASLFMALVILCNVYTYYQCFVSADPDFVANYKAGRGTVLPIGAHHSAPIKLDTKTVEFKTPPPEAKVSVDTIADLGKDRPLVNLVFGVPTRPPVVFSSTFLNELAAVNRCTDWRPKPYDPLDMRGHVFETPADYVPGWFRSGPSADDLKFDPKARQKRLVIHDFPDLKQPLRQAFHRDDVEWVDWFKRYPLTKRLDLLKAAQQHAEGFVPVRTLKAFVKAEKMNIMNELGTTEKDPRMINATDSTYNEYIGPYIHRASKLFAEAINGQPFKMERGCGAPLIKTHVMLDGDYMGLNYWVGEAQGLGAVWCEGDVERMDGNYEEVSMEAVHTFYQEMGFLIEVQEFIAHSQEHRRAFTRHGVSYDMDFKRASGEPDTSFGNTVMSIIMATIAVENYCLWKTNFLKQVLLCVLGDDVLIGLIFNYNPEVPIDTQREMEIFCKSWRTAARKCGFTLKTSHTRELCRAEFLSGVFWPIKRQIVPYPLPSYYCDQLPAITVALGVKPGRWIMRAGWVLEQSDDMARVYAIARGSLVSNDFLTAHVPFVSQMVEVLLTKLPERTIVTNTNELPEWKTQATKTYKLELDKLQMSIAFESRYNMTLSTLDGVVANVRTTELPMFVSHPALDVMIDRDQ